MRLLDVEWDGSLYPYSPKRLGLRVAIWAPPDCRHQMGLGAVAGALRSHACRQAMSPKRPCQPRFGSDSSHAERALERIEPEWRHDTTAPSGRVYYRIAPTFDWAGRTDLHAGACTAKLRPHQQFPPRPSIYRSRLPARICYPVPASVLMQQVCHPEGLHCNHDDRKSTQRNPDP
jgi:hypothetical protein